MPNRLKCRWHASCSAKMSCNFKHLWRWHASCRGRDPSSGGSAAAHPSTIRHAIRGGKSKLHLRKPLMFSQNHIPGKWLCRTVSGMLHKNSILRAWLLQSKLKQKKGCALLRSLQLTSHSAL
jgi:hypothetical protein